MRLDRLSMAHAIVDGDLYWSYKGVEDFRPSRRNEPTRGRSLNTLAQTLLSCAIYTDNQINSTVEYYLSEDYDDEWREYCEHRAHKWDCCPNDGCANTLEVYQTAVEERFRDQKERSKWAYERVDTSWLRDDTIDHASDVFWVAWFLKEHPVEGVMTREGEYLDFDEVKGFCQCGEPIDETCFERWGAHPGVSPHPLTPGCHDCDTSHVNGATCGFDHDGSSRIFMECPHCAETWALDEREERVIGLLKRPFHWPPEAPYPPRLSFDLRPMDAPPEELETY